MALRYAAGSITVAVLVVGTAASAVAQSPTRTISVNDNRQPAGVLTGDILVARIYVDRGEWRPEENDGPALAVAAFGEEGGAQAANLKIAEQYINEFGKLAKSANTLVVPSNLSDVGAMIGLAMSAIRQKAEPSSKGPLAPPR